MSPFQQTVCIIRKVITHHCLKNLEKKHPWVREEDCCQKTEPGQNRLALLSNTDQGNFKRFLLGTLKKGLKIASKKISLVTQLAPDMRKIKRIKHINRFQLLEVAQKLLNSRKLIERQKLLHKEKSPLPSG